MGAGRQTQTFQVLASAGPSGGGAIGPPPQRNLGRTDLGGVIFGCTNVTMSECLSKSLFGLPAQHIKYVQHIRPGMCLFLFNYSGRLLHGIYEAAGDGGLNIDPSAWTDGRGKTQYPAQVKFKLRQSCSPLPEPVFKEAILDNYFSEIKFTFELTIPQKDHLLSLFTNNMQGPTKSISSNTASYPLKLGGSVKGWKKVGDSEDAWAARPKTFTPAIGNAWQKVGPVVAGKGSSEDVKAYNFHHSGKSKEEAFGKSSEILSDASKLASGAGDGTMSDDQSSIYPEVDRQEGDYGAYGVTSFQGQSSDVKNVVAGNVNSNDNAGKKELDKAARQRNILEKLQRLDPSRADITQQQQPTISEKFQGLNIASVDQSQQRDTLQGGIQYSSHDEVDSSGGTVVAITPMRTHADWERHAKEKASLEQAMLREDRDRLWVTTSAVDMNTATAFKRSLEVSAGTIAQMRQDSIEVHQLMIELRARTDQQLEQQKTLEKLLTTNSMLEQSQASMAAELAKMRLEMSELKSQFNVLSSQGQEHSNKLLYLSASRSYAGSPVSEAQRVPQAPEELYILGGLADVWLDSVVAYSPLSNQLKNVASLLAPRSYACSSILHGYVYLYGGGDGTSWSDSVERYNRASDTWETCASMAIKRGSLGGATVRDKIYALGGGNGAISFDDTECYDPIVGTWASSAKMLERRFCVASAELNGVIYALGGFDGQNYLMSVERFDPREGLWTAIAPMGARRGSLSAACLNEKLYALGGFDGRNFLNSVEIYDPRANNWMPGPSMISPRAYGASAVVGDALYTLGGMEYMNQSFQTSKMKVEKFTESAGWQAVPMSNMINRNFVAAAVL